MIVRSPSRFIFFALFAFFAAKSEAQFTSYEIKPGGDIISLALRDLGGDKSIDPAVAWYRTEKTGELKRHITFYSPPNGSDVTAVRDHEVPDDAITFGLGDYMGEGKAQIVYITSRSVVAVPILTSQPNRLLENQPFISSMPAPRQLPFWDYTDDLNADGRADLILAGPNSYSVFTQDAGHKLVPSGRLQPEFDFGPDANDSDYAGGFDESEVASRRPGGGQTQPSGGPPPAVAKGSGMKKGAAPINNRRRLNRVCIADLNGDKRLDLFAMKKDKLWASLQNGSGTFADQPDLKLPLGPQGVRHAWDNSRLPIAYGDINADGRLDFVIADVDAKDLSTKLRLYLWTKAGIPDQPNQLIKLSGLGELPHLIDLNGDGTLDLSYLTLRADKMVKVGKPSTEELDATHYVFLFDKTKANFSRSPDADKEFTIAVNQNSDDNDEQVYTHFEGDFNGDGVRDLVVFENRDELLVYQCTASGEGKMNFKIPSKPTIRYKTSAPREIWVNDLNGDNRSDVTLQFKDRLQLLISNESK